MPRKAPFHVKLRDGRVRRPGCPADLGHQRLHARAVVRPPTEGDYPPKLSGSGISLVAFRAPEESAARTQGPVARRSLGVVSLADAPLDSSVRSEERSAFGERASSGAPAPAGSGCGSAGIGPSPRLAAPPAQRRHPGLRCRAERAACEEAGLRDADLTGVSGVSKAKLVHARRFVAAPARVRACGKWRTGRSRSGQ